MSPSLALNPSCSDSADSGKASLIEALNRCATVKYFRRGQEISSGQPPGRSWYRIVSGAARRCATQPDGRRQNIAILLPNDFFGFYDDSAYGCLVEAISEGTAVAEYPRAAVEAMADANPSIARMIRDVAFETISRLEGQLLLLGRQTAREKVCLFMLDMAERLAEQEKITLPISRYDIADYLAISVETVCRSLTDLKNEGTIALESARKIGIVDREALLGANL
jgi:CRP-like cAMP-binding protein